MTTKKLVCQNCAALRDFQTVNRVESYDVRGEKISFPVRLLACKVCGETFFDEKRDGALLERAYAEYRRRRGLLLPLDIKRIRERYGLTQRAFAALLGVAQPTIARYETGAIQDDAHDRLIRVYGAPANMQVLLEERGHLLPPDQIARAKETVQQYRFPDRFDFQRMVHSGPDEYTGFKPFDFGRYMRTVLWFCWNLESVASTKMNKLLFYADYVYFKLNSSSITGTAYRKLQWGPVPERYGMLRDLMESEGYICLQEKRLNDVVAVEYTPGPRAFEVELDFNECELAILGSIASTFKESSATEMSDRSHREKAWIDTPDRALISYMFAEHISIPDEQ